MNAATLNKIGRNMDMEKNFTEETLALLDEVKDKELPDVSPEDLDQLRNHCNQIVRAAETAKKLVAFLISIKKDKKQEAEEEKPGSKKTEKSAAAEPESAADDDDLSFLD